MLSTVVKNNKGSQDILNVIIQRVHGEFNFLKVIYFANAEKDAEFNLVVNKSIDPGINVGASCVGFEDASLSIEYDDKQQPVIIKHCTLKNPISILASVELDRLEKSEDADVKLVVSAFKTYLKEEKKYTKIPKMPCCMCGM